MSVHLCQADYANPVHAAAVVSLLDSYAQDPMGGGHPLSVFAREHLVCELAARPTAFSVLAFAKAVGAGLAEPQIAVGLANCIEGFSTFACKPLVNVHDLVVLASHRGQGVGEQLLNEVARIASQRGACKVTLEVLQGNTRAMGLYLKAGFKSYELDPAMGTAVMLQRWLDTN